MHYISEWFGSLINGSAVIPFLIIQDGIPKLNTARVWETMVTGLVASLGAAVFGWLMLVPEIKTNMALLDQKLTDHHLMEQRQEELYEYKHQQLKEMIGDLKEQNKLLSKDKHKHP